MVAMHEPDGIRPFSPKLGISMPLGMDYSTPVSVARLVDGTLTYTISKNDPEYPYIASLMVKKNRPLQTVEQVIRVERQLQKEDEAVLVRVSPKLSVEFGTVENGSVVPLVEVSRFGGNTLFSLNNGTGIAYSGETAVLHSADKTTTITPGYGWIQAGDRLVKLFVRNGNFGLSYAFTDNPHEVVSYVGDGEKRYREILARFFGIYNLPENIVNDSSDDPRFFIYAVLETFAQEDSTGYFTNLIRDVQKFFVTNTVFAPLIAEMEGNLADPFQAIRIREELTNSTRPPSPQLIKAMVDHFDPSLTVRFALNDEAVEIMKFRGTQNPPGAKR